MITAMYLIPLIITLLACTTHYLSYDNTLQFKLHYNSYFPKKSKEIFYDNHTFGIDIHPNPCEPMEHNDEYRKFINSRMKCTGELCHDNQYICKNDDSKDCYNVEHIFDANGSDFTSEKYNKNIAANMVMVWKEWNVELESLAETDYRSSKNEKTIIYGEGMMNRVRNMILHCKK